MYLRKSIRSIYFPQFYTLKSTKRSKFLLLLCISIYNSGKNTTRSPLTANVTVVHPYSLGGIKPDLGSLSNLIFLGLISTKNVFDIVKVNFVKNPKSIMTRIKLLEFCKNTISYFLVVAHLAQRLTL